MALLQLTYLFTELGLRVPLLQEFCLDAVCLLCFVLPLLNWHTLGAQLMLPVPLYLFQITTSIPLPLLTPPRSTGVHILVVFTPSPSDASTQARGLSRHHVLIISLAILCLSVLVVA